MLLWPEHNQTSPMRTFEAVTFSPPLEATTVWGVKLAPKVSSITSQCPSASALVVTGGFLDHEAETLTEARGEAVPQMRTLVFCWRTMLSPIMEENLRLPAMRAEQASSNAAAKIIFLISLVKMAGRSRP
jgi:hypothetical protein